jgi:hypothetical protein
MGPDASGNEASLCQIGVWVHAKAAGVAGLCVGVWWLGVWE